MATPFFPNISTKITVDKDEERMFTILFPINIAEIVLLESSIKYSSLSTFFTLDSTSCLSLIELNEVIDVSLPEKKADIAIKIKIITIFKIVLLSLYYRI